ncbi:MAG: SMC family ATPase [Candidatus Aenigmatarchaeota archaeon]
MIKRVILRNWKSHLESILEFPKGVNIILGINGSGKSSLFDAICFGLYGTTPDLQSKKVKLDDLIMRKPYQKNEAEVIVEFECDGNIYTVKRNIKSGRGTVAELRENGKLIEIQSSQRVNEIIEERLKTSFDLFSKIIYSKQNSLDYFLNLSPSERKKKIDEILMIENFEKARIASNTLITRLEERILEKERFIKILDIEKIIKEGEEKKKEISEIEDWLTPIKNKLIETSTRRIFLEEEYSKNKKIKEHLEILKKEEASLSSLIFQLSEDLKNLSMRCKNVDRNSVIKELEKIKKENKELEKYTNDLKVSIEKKTNKKLEILSSLNLATKKIEEMEERLKEIIKIEEEIRKTEERLNQKIIEEEEKSLIEMKSMVSTLTTNILKLEENIKKLEEVENKCPVCDSKITEEKKKYLIEKRKEEIEKWKEEIENLRNKIREKEEKIKKLKEELRFLDVLKLKMGEKENLEKEIEFYKNQEIIEKDNLATLEKELEEIKKELEEKEKMLKDYIVKKSELELLLNQIIEYEEKNEKLEEINKKYKIVKEEIKNLESQLSLVSLEKIEEELMKTIVVEKELAIEIKNKEELKQRIVKELEEIEKKIQTFEKEKKEVERLKKIVEDLKIFREALKVTQEKLREEFVQAINSYMNLIWSNLYPYKDFVTIELKIENGDYTLQLQERSGRWINVEGIVSGGERSLAALSLRIAFSLVLAPQMRILILDEPTHNLDSNSVEELAKVLRESVSEFLDQVFIITHDEKLENAVTGKIYRFERKKETDEFTRIIEI